MAATCTTCVGKPHRILTHSHQVYGFLWKSMRSDLFNDAASIDAIYSVDDRMIN
jgi:hypothetical protein